VDGTAAVPVQRAVIVEAPPNTAPPPKDRYSISLVVHMEVRWPTVGFSLLNFLGGGGEVGAVVGVPTGKKV
jgi:hypothetical protein